MEDIYTIKVRSRPDPTNLYPSERRYSASTVLGLGVVHLALGLTAFLLAILTLIAKNDEINSENHQFDSTIETIPVHLTIQDLQNPEISRKIEMFSRTNVYIKRENILNTTVESSEDIRNSSSVLTKSSSISASFTFAPCIMSVAAFIAGCTAILAWRRWYIDQNIMWFFISSVISTTVSLICLIAIISGIANIASFKLSNYYASNPNHFVLRSENGIEILRPIISDNKNTTDNGYHESKTENLRTVLAINIAIAAVLELIWSYLSAKISWRGMRNGYSDDLHTRRGGNVSVNTVIKGNNIGKHKKINPKPDIIAHYPKKGKIAKYFPKTENDDGYLPKAESHKEYQERVNKFLASHGSDDVEN